MRLLPPLNLLLSSSAMLFYYAADSETMDYRYDSLGWSIYFYSTLFFTLSLSLIIPVLIRENDEISLQFQVTHSIYAFLFGTGYVLNYFGIVTEPYGFVLTLSTVLIGTLLIVYNGWKYGLFKDDQ